MRFKVPETMKYFCTTEAVAMYLQKHIVYRKRKIFYGTGTPESVVALIGPKHKGEKFLIAASDGSNSGPITEVFEKAGLDHTLGTIVKAVPQDLGGLDIHSYGIVVLYSPFDVASLKENFPGFEQGGHQVHLLRQVRRGRDGGGWAGDSPQGPTRGAVCRQGHRNLSGIPQIDGDSGGPYPPQGGKALRQEGHFKTVLRGKMGRRRASALLLGHPHRKFPGAPATTATGFAAAAPRHLAAQLRMRHVKKAASLPTGCSSPFQKDISSAR